MIVFFLISLALTILSCEGCFNKSQKQALGSSKKSIIIGISQEPDTLFIPFKEMMAAEEMVRAGNYALTCFDQERHIIPWAAKEIPTKENGLLVIFSEKGQKKMRVTWHIKENFAWPDGKPLVADDFIFMNKIMQDPAQEVLDRSVSDNIEKMEAKGKDRRTLVVTWKQPYAYYHNYAQHEALPQHLLLPLYNQSPAEFIKSRYGQTPALAGSFTIKDWVPGSHIIAIKNPAAKGVLMPQLDQIIWRIIPETNTLASNLISGAIDAISTTGLSLEQARQLEQSYKDDFDFYYTEGLVWEHIDFNLDNKIFKDKRVRKALTYASDKEAMAKALFAGRQSVAHGTEPAKSLYFNDAITKYFYNPEMARKLLDEAGWLLKPGQEIREKNGQRLSIIIRSTSGNKVRERIEQLLQSFWRNIGVELLIKNQPAKVFFGETMRKRKFEHLALYSWYKDPLKVADTLWSCSNIPSEKNNFQGQNMPGFCMQKVDKLMNEASTELDEKKRAKLGQEFEAIFAEELPAIPLFFQVEVSITKKGLKNWKPTGILQPVSWNAYEWAWEDTKK